jgi:hypothetical protein
MFDDKGCLSDILVLPFLCTLISESDRAEIRFACCNPKRNPTPRSFVLRRRAAIGRTRWTRCSSRWLSGVQKTNQHDQPILRSSDQGRDASTDREAVILHGIVGRGEWTGGCQSQPKKLTIGPFV